MGILSKYLWEVGSADLNNNFPCYGWAIPAVGGRGMVVARQESLLMAGRFAINMSVYFRMMHIHGAGAGAGYEKTVLKTQAKKFNRIPPALSFQSNAQLINKKVRFVFQPYFLYPKTGHSLQRNLYPFQPNSFYCCELFIYQHQISPGTGFQSAQVIGLHHFGWI